MFKKPLGQLKTSAPIRASDRRKLKQRVLSAFSTSPEHGDLLVPDGILTAKFFTHTKQPGVRFFPFLSFVFDGLSELDCFLDFIHRSWKWRPSLVYYR